MSYLSGRTGSQYQTKWLTDEEKKSPFGIIESYFYDHSIGEVRDFYAQVQRSCLTIDQVPWNDAEKRADLLLYNQKTGKLLEAIWVIMIEREQARKKHSSK